MWQTASGKRRKKLETAEAKQAAEAFEVAAKLFAAAAAKAAADTLEAATRLEKDKLKSDGKAKGKAGDKSSLV